MAKKIGRGESSVKSLLDDPSRGVARCGGASGALSKLFRQIVHDLDITLPEWNRLMIDYLRDPRNKVPDNRKDQSSMRGNLTKEFSRPDMSHKVFLKAMRFFQVVKITFSVELTFRSGRKTGHATEVELDNPNNFVFRKGDLGKGAKNEYGNKDGGCE